MFWLAAHVPSEGGLYGVSAPRGHTIEQSCIDFTVTVVVSY
jgi:hypothetical protein